MLRRNLLSLARPHGAFFLKKYVNCWKQKEYWGHRLLDRQGGDIARFFNVTDIGGVAEELEGFLTEDTCILLNLACGYMKKGTEHTREGVNAFPLEANFVLVTFIQQVDYIRHGDAILEPDDVGSGFLSLEFSNLEWLRDVRHGQLSIINGRLGIGICDLD